MSPGSDIGAGILLLQPWIEDFYATDCRIQPIGLAYLAGALRRRFPESEVCIYDCLAGGNHATLHPESLLRPPAAN